MLSFEWDEEKEWSNYLKHRVRFNEAEVIWTDQNSIEIFDELHSEDEHRFIRLGLHPKLKLLVVVFCERKNVIRIISARKADGPEREYYERSLRF